MWPEPWNKRKKLDNHETHTALKVKSSVIQEIPMHQMQQ